MNTDAANSTNSLSSLENIAKLAPIFTVLILATSIIYDSAYLFALGLSFTDIPSSISEHIRSALLWSPIIFALLFFISTLYIADQFKIKNTLEEKTSPNNKLRYLIILIVVVAITGYQSFYLENKQYTFIGLIFIWAIRSGPANLNSAISGNSGHIQGVSNGQEISKTHASHPQRGI